MAFGMQVFGAGGNLVMDITDRLPRIVGRGNTGVQNGSVDIANALPGIGGMLPWVFALDPSPNFLATIRRPYFNVNGTVISWSFDDNGPPQYMAVDFLYGIY
jgi:hypothetical protein